MKLFRSSDILLALEWLCVWLLDMTYKKVVNLERKKEDSFTIRNNIQVFYATTLAIVYAQVPQKISLGFCEFITHVFNLYSEPFSTFFCATLTDWKIPQKKQLPHDCYHFTAAIFL